jgi:hypothetical protein
VLPSFQFSPSPCKALPCEFPFFSSYKVDVDR